MEEFLRQAKAISDPTRARMLKLLEAGELCVCDLMETLGLRQSTASKHLGILKTAGLVESRKKGLWSYYRLSERVRADSKDFLLFLSEHLNKDAQIKQDRRLLSRKRPSACKR